jgi:uncharacterized YccA/Bax inhibitor family protein
MNGCVITVAMAMLLRNIGLYIFYLSTLVGDHLLLRDLGPDGIIFMIICVYYLDFPVILDW